MSSKWGKAYWKDLGERAASSAVGGALALVGVQAITDLTPGLVWFVVGVPTVTSVLKGLLANLPGSEPSASIVDVTSTPSMPDRITIRGEGQP